MKERPPKPYVGFPLFAHANGCWKKKAGGKAVSFGVWRWPDPLAYEQSWRAALAAYERWLIQHPAHRPRVVRTAAGEYRPRVPRRAADAWRFDEDVYATIRAAKERREQLALAE